MALAASADSGPEAIIAPKDRRRASHGAARAPARMPAPYTPNVMPTPAAVRPRRSMAYTTYTACNTNQAVLKNTAVVSTGRSSGCVPTKAAPSRSSASKRRRVTGLGASAGRPASRAAASSDSVVAIT
ncbi:hypothetical protein G6F31_020321 [Rhizopus arrhizus]|nr:hypothetical protein G6F31_020321 [Rhizopus arrhizus]